MSLTLWLILYCILIIVASLAGGLVPMIVRLTHRRMQLATSLIAGFMLGVALLHLLPHALMSISPSQTVGWLLGGLLAMFFLERFFSFHHHTAPGEEGMPPVTADPEPEADCDHAPGPTIDHAHGHHHDHDGPHRLSWTGVTVGLVIHSLLGGAALAAAMRAEAHGSATAWLPGVAVFLVILLHKPFDSMTLLTLMTQSGWSRATRHTVNFLFSLAVPVGAIAFMVGLQSVDVSHSGAVGMALAFSAGVFLCVALADLLPEVHFHKHDKFALSAAVLLGLALAWAIAYFEHSSHAHQEGHGMTEHGHVDHSGHDH